MEAWIVGLVASMAKPFTCPFGSCGEQNKVSIPGWAEMAARNELLLWFVITTGLCMIQPSHLRVYPGGSNHNFSCIIVQNCGSFQPSSHFWSCTWEMLWLLREPFLNPASNAWRRLHMSKRFLSNEKQLWRVPLKPRETYFLVTATPHTLQGSWRLHFGRNSFMRAFVRPPT